jgi:hypothetical protein
MALPISGNEFSKALEMSLPHSGNVVTILWKGGYHTMEISLPHYGKELTT